MTYMCKFSWKALSVRFRVIIFHLYNIIDERIVRWLCRSVWNCNTLLSYPPLLYLYCVLHINDIAFRRTNGSHLGELFPEARFPLCYPFFKSFQCVLPWFSAFLSRFLPTSLILESYSRFGTWEIQKSSLQWKNSCSSSFKNYYCHYCCCFFSLKAAKNSSARW